MKGGKGTDSEVSNVEDALEHEQHGPLDGAHGQSVQRFNGQEGLLLSQPVSSSRLIYRYIAWDEHQPVSILQHGNLSIGSCGSRHRRDRSL